MTSQPTSTYQLIDSGDFQKLEQIGPYRVVRPAAQAVWRPRLGKADWQHVDAVFTRFSGGDGRWERLNPRLPASWVIDAPLGAFASRLVIRLTDFGHLGLFPEQHPNWQRLASLVASRKTRGLDTEVLNLFAYTGGSTLACAAAGASVVHLDASKTSVAWGRENAEASGLGDKPIRWIVDDVRKFVAREQRRGKTYHGLILDPPSFGRGPKSEAWQIEAMLPELLADLGRILAPDLAFILLSCHSNGYTPLALTNLLSDIIDLDALTVQAGEMTVAETVATTGTNREKGARYLPSGAACLVLPPSARADQP